MCSHINKLVDRIVERKDINFFTYYEISYIVTICADCGKELKKLEIEK